MSCKYRQDTKAANELFTGILEVYEVSSNRILGSCQAGMQCCGQAALCPQCSQLSLGCVVYPQFFQQPCERSVCISLSLLYPHDQWTNVPVAGTRSKSRGALWDRFVLQMGKRYSVIQSEKLWKEFLRRRQISVSKDLYPDLWERSISNCTLPGR